MILTLVSVVTSCSKDDDEEFDEAYIYGTWRENTVHYKYNTNGKGVTWDTADDVTKQEGQPFTRTLVKSELTHIHIMESSGGDKIPKIYTVSELTSTTLKYKDDFGVLHSFVKVK